MEQFKCKFFLKWQVLKPLNCLSWCYMNFSSDIHWQGREHFLLSVVSDRSTETVNVLKEYHTQLLSFHLPHNLLHYSGCNRTLDNSDGKMAKFVFENPKYYQVQLSVVLYNWQDKPYYETFVYFVNKYSKFRKKI